MNPYYGYQLYQAERTQSRAEILAGDARRGREVAGRRAAGRRAAAGRRGRRGIARKGRGRGIMALNIFAGRTVRAA